MTAGQCHREGSEVFPASTCPVQVELSLCHTRAGLETCDG